jgi:hypothetical protein
LKRLRLRPSLKPRLRSNLKLKPGKELRLRPSLKQRLRSKLKL